MRHLKYVVDRHENDLHKSAFGNAICMCCLQSDQCKRILLGKMQIYMSLVDCSFGCSCAWNWTLFVGRPQFQAVLNVVTNICDFDFVKLFFQVNLFFKIIYFLWQYSCQNLNVLVTSKVVPNMNNTRDSRFRCQNTEEPKWMSMYVDLFTFWQCTYIWIALYLYVENNAGCMISMLRYKCQVR